MSRYYLMNKDRKLLEFDITTSALGEEVKEIQKFSDVQPIGFSNIATWLDNRNYAKHKEHFRKWLLEWNISTITGFIETTHCLGINDSLWVKNIDSRLQWSEVNLYHNEFSDVAQRTAFETGLYGLQLSSTDIISPEFTSDGTAPKCWRVENNTIYLYKSSLSGFANVGKEAYSEYISANIARQLVGEESIAYELVMFKEKQCSKCELFTSEKYGYVPFYKYINTNETYTIKGVMDILAKMGYENEFRKMILIDSIVMNQDRHLGNFGFLVDNESFEIIGFAPFFDYNSSMLCNSMPEDINSIESFKTYEDQYMLGHKLGGKFSSVGKAILTPDLRDIVPQEITFPVHQRYNMDSERVNNILDILNYNTAIIMDKKTYQVKLPNIENVKAEEVISLEHQKADVEEDEELSDEAYYYDVPTGPRL